MRTAAPVPRAVPTLLQRGQGAPVAGVGPPRDLRQPRLEVAGRVAHRVVGVGGLPQQRAQADGGLPAAAPAAAAHDLRVAERGVPDLAGEPAGPAQQLVGHDHAAADADLAGQVDQVRGPRLGPHRPLRDRREVRVVLDPDRAVEVDPGPQALQHRDVVPADVGRVRSRRRRGCGSGPGRRRSRPPGRPRAPPRPRRPPRPARRPRPASRSAPSAGTSRAIRCSNSTSPRRSRTRVAA